MPLISFSRVLQAINMREKDQTMTTLLQHFDFYVMPVINVDGYEYTWSHPSVRTDFFDRLCNVLTCCLWKLLLCMSRA